MTTYPTRERAQHAYDALVEDLRDANDGYLQGTWTQERWIGALHAVDAACKAILQDFPEVGTWPVLPNDDARYRRRLDHEEQIADAARRDRDDERPYSVFHSNVDGAGFIDRFSTLDRARAEADRLQAKSDEDGNPWGYRYWVFGRTDRCLYRTQASTSAPPQEDVASRRREDRAEQVGESGSSPSPESPTPSTADGRPGVVRG
jgi:hypothetical protein